MSSLTLSDPPRTAPEVGPRSHEAPTPRRSWLSALAWSLPNVVVFLLLGSVLYLGHHTGWRMPKLSSLTATTPAKHKDWCEEHLVPESQCVECNRDLFPRAKEFGFCREHGVAECVLDHPDLAQVHGDPQLPRYDTLRALALRPRAENNSRNTLHKSLVQFTSLDTVAKAGIDVDLVQERAMDEHLTANGEVRFDPTRVAHLSAKAPGSVVAVFKIQGDTVKAGEVLALIDAALVGQAKSQLVQSSVQMRLAASTVKRLQGISSTGAVPQKTVIEAEAAQKEAEVAFLAARQALVNLGFEVPVDAELREAKDLTNDLQFLGLGPEIIEQLGGATKTGNLLPMRAPFTGTVVMASVARGEVVDGSKPLLTVADPASVWLTLNVRQEDAPYLAEGHKVLFRPDDGTPEVRGEVTWVSPTIDERTRTLEARVAFDPTQRRVRDKTFGTGRIILREEPNAIAVPKEALQSTPDAQFVFVRDKDFLKDGSPKVFHVRQVRIGARDGEFVELLAGVLPGEVVATKGSGAILAQLLRSSFGAGCGCHEEK